MNPLQQYKDFLSANPGCFNQLIAAVYKTLYTTAPSCIILEERASFHHYHQIATVFITYLLQYIKYRTEIGGRAYIPPVFAMDESLGCSMSLSLVRTSSSVMAHVQVGWGDQVTERTYPLKDFVPPEITELLRK